MTNNVVDELDEEPATRLGRKRDHSRDGEILEAALDVLAESGYDGMTVDMVAARAHAGKATLYRRWPSKAELVIDAVACMKGGDPDRTLPDTGTLRGDLVALIHPPAIDDGERKLRVMAGLVSLLSREPELAESARDAVVAPRVALNIRLFRRAVERGEVPAGRDLELIASVSGAMVAQRVLLLRLPVTRDFMISVIDGVILPALGVDPA
jgi:AcrR family transcriptional regulator